MKIFSTIALILLRDNGKRSNTKASAYKFADEFGYFASLEYHRFERNKLHKLLDIIVLTICPVISGAEGWKSIKSFGRETMEWLRRFIALENGIPSHDCIARVMSKLPSKQLTQCLVSWVQSVSELTEGEIVAAKNAYDGHTLDAVLEQIEKLRGSMPDVGIRDRGYRGRSRVKGYKKDIISAWIQVAALHADKIEEILLKEHKNRIEFYLTVENRTH